MTIAPATPQTGPPDHNQQPLADREHDENTAGFVHALVSRMNSAAGAPHLRILDVGASLAPSRRNSPKLPPPAPAADPLGDDAKRRLTTRPARSATAQGSNAGQTVPHDSQTTRQPGQTETPRTTPEDPSVPEKTRIQADPAPQPREAHRDAPPAQDTRSDPPVAPPVPHTASKPVTPRAPTSTPALRIGSVAPAAPRTPGPQPQAQAGPNGNPARATREQSQTKAATKTPLRMQNQRAIAQVRQGLATVLRRGGGVMTLRLQPEALGQVKVRLELRDQNVRVRFETTSQQARQLLDTEVRALRTALEARGLHVERISVQLTTDSQPGGPALQNGGPDTDGRGSSETNRDAHSGDSRPGAEKQTDERSSQARRDPGGQDEPTEKRSGPVEPVPDDELAEDDLPRIHLNALA